MLCDDVAGKIMISCISHSVVLSILDSAFHQFESSDWYVAKMACGNHVGLHNTWLDEDVDYDQQGLYKAQLHYGNIL